MHRTPARSPAVAASILLFSTLLIPGAPTPASAQTADFMMKRPVATLGLMGGWAMPGESSDLFTFTQESLTVKRGDFAGPLVGAELALAASERVQVAVGLERASRTVDSESRDYVTQDNLPILQSTEFTRTTLGASARYYLIPAGRVISEFAWIPSRFAPYLGAGVGRTWYVFKQEGDFVNEATLDIISTTYRSKGDGTTAHAQAGLDVSVGPRFLVRGEFRHTWGNAEIDLSAYQGFEDVDVSGSRLALGVAVRL
jgi:hypothetical protein